MPDPEEFYRIKRLPPYVFAEVNRLTGASVSTAIQMSARSPARGVRLASPFLPTMTIR